MQHTIQESKFRRQIVQADKKTQVFFNELLRTLNRSKLNIKLLRQKSNAIFDMKKSNMEIITTSKLNLQTLLKDTK